MGSGSILLGACSILYLISGGRWTVVLLGVVLTILYKVEKSNNKVVASPHQKEEIITKKPTKESPIYAVDFTSTSFTPSATTVIPKQTVRSRAKRSPKIIKATKPRSLDQQTPQKQQSVLTKSSIELSKSQIYIFYTTLTGSSQRIAKSLYEKLTGLELDKEPKLLSLDDDVDDLEEYFLKVPEENAIYLLVLPSYETDSPIDYFLEHLIDTFQDFRVDKYPLRKINGFSVLGLGDSESWSGEKFCYQSKLADKWLGKLGARRLYPLGQVCMKYQGEPKAQEWIQNFASMLDNDEPFYIDENDVELII